MQAIHFGTDGWRAIIGEGFTEENLIRVVEASAKAFKIYREENPSLKNKNTIIIGHDCRQNAHEYAKLAAEVAAAEGFDIVLTQDYCPTPCLCWSVAEDDQAIGGIMLTSSHNPAEYLGVKLRMADGGASSAEFTNRVESLLSNEISDKRGSYKEADLVTPYLEKLKSYVNPETIRNAHLKVVIDPLYGAGRHYLASILKEMGVEVCEINNASDASFDGLHPEPIPPWINRCCEKVVELKYDAGFINDGDADRIGAVDEYGNFVNPHRIMTLLVGHLAEDLGKTGRVVSTITASTMLSQQCERLKLPFVVTPVGFKWIYAEMQKGNVLLGGEESGGIGLPNHVMERDGLLMALLLVEMMAEKKMSLGELLDDMFTKVDKLEFERRGLKISAEQMEVFKNKLIKEYNPQSIAGKKVLSINRMDGIKIILKDSAWLAFRPSGTEPLVRMYAEAKTAEEVDQILEEAEKILEKETINK